MAKQPANAARIYLNHHNVSGYLTGFTDQFTQETMLVTALSDAGPRRLVGGYDVQASSLGLIDTANDDYDEQAWDAILDNSDHYLTRLPTGSAENSISYDYVVRLTAQPRSGAIGQAILLNFEAAGANGAVRGLVLASVTSTGAESRTGRNQGVTAAGTTYAVTFRLLAFTGTNITMVVQESQNDGSPDTYATISGLTSGALTAVGTVRATTTAATEAWKRVALTGTYSSALILVTAGTVQGT